MPHELWLASLAQRVGGPARLALLAMFGTALAGAGFAFAQDDQQARCMQLQQELASARGGGGGQLPAIDRQIQDATRVYRGTKAAMDDAGCFERGFLIFGRGLVRTPKCLQMNNRVEDARRQVDQLQEQRAAIAGGGGNRRRQAELMDALARNGCGGQYQQPVRRDSGGGGLFGWFGRERVQEPDQQYSNQPVYRSIDPNGRYRAVCVRTCDGFYFPITYQTYAGRLAQDAAQCQASCAAPAELYVYRNPGQDMEQAISLNGVPYQELPNAFKFKTTYVKGCSCKESEYNPTEIEAANQKAEATPAAGTKKKATAAAAPAPQPAAAQAPQQLDINVTGAIPNTGAAQPQPATEAEAAAPADAAPPAQQSSMAKSQPAPAQ